MAVIRHALLQNLPHLHQPQVDLQHWMSRLYPPTAGGKHDQASSHSQGVTVRQAVDVMQSVAGLFACEHTLRQEVTHGPAVGGMQGRY